MPGDRGLPSSNTSSFVFGSRPLNFLGMVAPIVDGALRLDRKIVDRRVFQRNWSYDKFRRNALPFAPIDRSILPKISDVPGRFLGCIKQLVGPNIPVRPKDGKLFDTTEEATRYI